MDMATERDLLEKILESLERIETLLDKKAALRVNLKWEDWCRIHGFIPDDFIVLSDREGYIHWTGIKVIRWLHNDRSAACIIERLADLDKAGLMQEAYRKFVEYKAAKQYCWDLMDWVRERALGDMVESGSIASANIEIVYDRLREYYGPSFQPWMKITEDTLTDKIPLGMRTKFGESCRIVEEWESELDR